MIAVGGLPGLDEADAIDAGILRSTEGQTQAFGAQSLHN